jgi:hypothetical protein
MLFHRRHQFTTLFLNVVDGFAAYSSWQSAQPPFSLVFGWQSKGVFSFFGLKLGFLVDQYLLVRSFR